MTVPYGLIADLCASAAEIFRTYDVQCFHCNQRKEIYLESIDSLNLSVRANYALIRGKIRTIGDLARTTKYQLLGIKDVGETMFMQICEALSTIGVVLGEAIERK